MLNFNVKNASSLKIYEFYCDNLILKNALDEVKKINYEINIHNQISIHRINDLREFKSLHEWFQLCIDEVFLDLKLPQAFKKIILTESWANKSNRNEAHHSHSHPNSYLSAIFYLTSNSSGYTKFESENMWYNNEYLFDAHKNECGFNRYNVFAEKPEAGKLLIFPSTLRHHVEPNFGDDARYTISFNAYPEIHNERTAVYFNIKVLPYDRNRVDIEE
jgi:uncharacterized protein (TIGR02466 family)